MNPVLRQQKDADLPFLRGLYASTRTEELVCVPWAQAEKQSFLDFQFQAQQHHYRQHYPDACFDLVLLAGQPAGRLYVARWPSEIRIVDIALMPQWRGQGLGEILLRGLLGEAAAVGKLVSIHVEKQNPAARLYRRLGFKVCGEHGPYDLMHCEPTMQAAA